MHYLSGLPTSFMIVLLANGQLQAQITDNLATDPGEARFVYEDVQNFLRAHEMLSSTADTVAILQAEYFERGTPGLNLFVEKYDLTPERLAKAIREHPEDYAALGDRLAWLRAEEQVNREAFTELKGHLPTVVYPPTYYLVGAWRGIGSGSVEGQLITIEKKASAGPKHDMRTLLVHELVHFQQGMAIGYEKYIALFGPEKSLLGLTIREGTAEFFADLVTGQFTQEEAREYVMSHEGELWQRFQGEMNGSETGDWMWQQPSDPEQPPHVAYVLGARIVKSYYDSGADRERAVNEILSVTDYESFLDRSGYANRFSGEGYKASKVK
ncbi:MAG: hypothetical protein JSU87_14215 [Gemmatimonadota bacterium]|nr:MAG: hypothetical protein JSU87_14215 [Gemmatimonadota bacterium]